MSESPVPEIALNSPAQILIPFDRDLSAATFPVLKIERGDRSQIEISANLLVPAPTDPKAILWLAPAGALSSHGEWRIHALVTIEGVQYESRPTTRLLVTERFR